MAKDHYTTLGLDESADADQIRRAYRGLAKAHHPDRSDGATSDRFREIREAYDVLFDAERRGDYDRTRNVGPIEIPIRRRERASVVVADEQPVVQEVSDPMLRLLFALLRR